MPLALAGVSLLVGVATATVKLDSYDALLPAGYFIPFLLYMKVTGERVFRSAFT